jgi:hypothetical protein
MTMPRRVQVTGDLFHGKVPDGAVYIGRAAPGLPQSRWANPFKPGARRPGEPTVIDAEHAAALYRRLLAESPAMAAQAVTELGGKDLACWCKPGKPCHGIPLLEAANPGLAFPPVDVSPAAPQAAADPDMPAFDEKTLSVTTRLILHTIVARCRGGEMFWTFDDDLLPQLQTAEQEGVIWIRSGPAPDCYQAWLTEAAERQFLGSDWLTPMDRMNGHYMSALAEIGDLWTAAAVEAANINGLLAYRTLPAKARESLEGMRARLRAAAGRRARGAYAYVSPAVRAQLRVAAGGWPIISPDMWERWERPGRPAGDQTQDSLVS